MVANPALALLTSAAPTTQAAVRATEGTNRALQQIEGNRRADVSEGLQRETLDENKRRTAVSEDQRQQGIDITQQKQAADRFGRLIDFTLQGDPAGIADRYTRSRAAAEKMGADVSSLPEQFTPEIVPQLQALRAEFSDFKQLDQTKTFAPTTIQDPDDPDGGFIKVIPQVGRDGSITIKRVGETKDLTPGEIASLEGDKSFEKEKGKATAQQVTKGFEQIQGIDQNILNIDKAIEAVQDGAGTGAIERLFPSIKAASVELDQLQGELALDVVGSTTFGALSKGELDLAKSVAIPTGLDGPELIEWLQSKKAAQTKLRDYFFEQVQFLDGGGSVAEFLELKEQEQNQKGGQIPTITSQEEFDALKPGAKFIEDGVERVKT